METAGTGAAVPRIRVLVADGEELLVHTLATILELACYQACALYGGVAALRLMELLQPELVLTDMSAPGSAAVEIPFVGWRSLPRCKVLLFTGIAGLYDLLQRKGAAELPFDVVTQPIRATDLLQRLRPALCSEYPALLVPIEIGEDPVH